MENKINKSGKLLIEFFSEEIPARMQARAADDFKKPFNALSSPSNLGPLFLIF